VSSGEADAASEDDTVGSEIYFRAAPSLRVHEDVLSGINQAFAASGIWPLRPSSSAHKSVPKMKMLTKTKIVLSAALVLNTAFSASAATKARLSHVHRPAIFDIVPDLSASSGAPVRDYIADPIIAPERDRHRTAG
jgi:hypothetical protein